MSNKSVSKLSFVGVIVSLGIIYGDIGTSPLYVVKAIIHNNIIDKDFILGALSCIIWTLTLQTTLKYVLITLKADNRGEGGILALYALIRRWSKIAFFPALIGSAALLADGVITPSITVTSSVEGLRLLIKDVPVIPIVIIILVVLFVIQQFGTQKIGKYFGPIMFFWFLMLGILGFSQFIYFPEIVKSFNPYYAYKVLTEHPGGVFILGAVFLATTGAEALYSDLGHCGLKNIRVSWIYVKSMLIMNYLGQGAWVILHSKEINNSTNPFFTIMPSWFLIPGIIIATIAAIIASQALISGTYTIISEAIRLNLWPKVTIKYPTEVRGQLYIPSINWLLLSACILIVLLFQDSSAMEAAYGLSITITMMMTTILVSNFLYSKRISFVFIVLFVAVFGTIEMTFLYANLNKFTHGGWVTILMASFLFTIMYIWNRGHKIKFAFYRFEDIKKNIPIIEEMSKDESLPKYATNLVYFTAATSPDKIEAKVIYSIINKKPKRADNYWFLHISILDEPFAKEYKITRLSGNITRIDFYFGFKERLTINKYFRQILTEMVKDGEFDITSNYYSLHKFNIPGDFCFIIIDRVPTFELELSQFQRFIMNVYYSVRKLGISENKEFGLDTSNVVIETVPLSVPKTDKNQLVRIN